MSPASRALLLVFFRTHSGRSGLEECRQLRWLWILVAPGYVVVPLRRLQWGSDVVDEVDSKLGSGQQATGNRPQATGKKQQIPRAERAAIGNWQLVISKGKSRAKMQLNGYGSQVNASRMQVS